MPSYGSIVTPIFIKENTSCHDFRESNNSKEIKIFPTN